MRHFLPNGKQLEIRPAEINDAKGCLECFLQLTQETDFLLYTRAEAEIYDVAAETVFIASHLDHPGHLFLVADVEGEIVGSLTLQQHKFRKQHHIAMLGIAVLHKYWNMGIGRRLLTAAIRWVEEHPVIAVIYFEVLSTNERAIQLYRNFNFTEHGRIPQGIRQPDGSWVDLVVMSKRFKPL